MKKFTLIFIAALLYCTFTKAQNPASAPFSSMKNRWTIDNDKADIYGTIYMLQGFYFVDDTSHSVHKKLIQWEFANDAGSEAEPMYIYTVCPYDTLLNVVRLRSAPAFIKSNAATGNYIEIKNEYGEKVNAPLGDVSKAEIYQLKNSSCWGKEITELFMFYFSDSNTVVLYSEKAGIYFLK